MKWLPIEQLTEETLNSAWMIVTKIKELEEGWVVSRQNPGLEYYQKTHDHFCIIPEPEMPFVPEIGRYYFIYNDLLHDTDLPILKLQEIRQESKNYMPLYKANEKWFNACEPVPDSEKELI